MFSVLFQIIICVILTNIVTKVMSNLCAQNKLDNVYTRLLFRREDEWFSMIIIVVKDSQYAWNTEFGTVGSPLKILENDKRVITKVQIIDPPLYNNTNCSESIKE